MTYLKQKLALLLGILLACLVPAQAAFAADNVTGVAFKVNYTDGRYEVFMKPNATPDSFNITLTAQVTLKVPHGTGADRFDASDIQNAVPGTAWTLSSRVDAPSEDPSADYLSFTVDFPDGNRRVYQWQANQEIKMFSFANTGKCLGATLILSDNDPFMVPNNSANTNPGNQIDILGLPDGNLFIGSYGGPASCGAFSAPNSIFLPFINR